MGKFNRNYKLSVETADGNKVIITRPFTLEFDVQRDSLGGSSNASFRIYNLSEKNRNLIRKDSWNFLDIRMVDFKGGYGDNLPTLAVGNISSAWSVREGNNFITTIETFDGGWAFTHSQTSAMFPSNTPNRSIVGALAENMNAFGVKTGAIGNIKGSTTRGNSISGNTANLLSELTGGASFIDNGKINVLSDGEAISGPVIKINSQSGLLGTPLRENTYLKFDVLFEPQVQIGYLIELESITGANFNGLHKVYSLSHRGVISDAIAGNAMTTIGVLDGSFTLIESASQ